MVMMEVGDFVSGHRIVYGTKLNKSHHGKDLLETCLGEQDIRKLKKGGRTTRTTNTKKEKMGGEQLL